MAALALCATAAACAGRVEPTATASPAAATAAEVAAITAVRERFQAAIVARDEAAMLGLMIAPDVPFRARRVSDGGLHASTAADFARAVGAATGAWREDFSDEVITARDGLAVLDARYRFVEDGRVTNHGREVWTLVETADGWKISSVSWSIILD